MNSVEYSSVIDAANRVKAQKYYKENCLKAYNGDSCLAMLECHLRDRLNVLCDRWMDPFKKRYAVEYALKALAL